MESQHCITIHWWVRGEGGGVPQGGKVKQESLAWFPLKGLARPQVSHSVSLQRAFLSLLFLMYLYTDVFHWDFSLNLIIKSYQWNLQVDLAQASPTGPLCWELPINITVNQEIGVKHTHSENFNQSYFQTVWLITWHCRCQTPFSDSEDVTDSSLSFPPKGRGVVLIPKHIQVYSRQTGPNGS